MVPENCGILNKLVVPTVVKVPNSVGSVPLKAASVLNATDVKLVIFPSSVGRVPDNVGIVPKRKVFNFVKVANWVGIVPLMALLRTLNTVIAVI